MFVRGLFASALIVTVASAVGALRHPTAALSRLMVWRTAAEVGATVFFFSALVRLPFADVNAVAQFTPLAVTAGAALFFGEPVGWRRWLAAIAGLIGVLIIIRPGTSAFDWAAVFVLGSVFFVTMRDLITRRMGHAVPALFITAMSAISVTVSGLLLLPFEAWRLPSPGHVLLLAGAAVTLLGGYYWIVIAMRTGEIAVVAPFRYAATMFAVLSGWIVFGELPDAMTTLGILIVLAAGLYTFHRERVRMQERLR
jgi:drug/metabolite transporter (DMT)-like permease